MARKTQYTYPDGTAYTFDFDKISSMQDEFNMHANELQKKHGGAPTIIKDPEFVIKPTEAVKLPGGLPIPGIPSLPGMTADAFRGATDFLGEGVGSALGAGVGGAGGVLAGAPGGPGGIATGIGILGTAGAGLGGGLGQAGAAKLQEAVGLVPSSRDPVQAGKESAAGELIGMGIPAIGKALLRKSIRGGQTSKEALENIVKVEDWGGIPSVPQTMRGGHWTAGALDWMSRNPVTTGVVQRWSTASNKKLAKEMIDRTKVDPMVRMLREGEKGMTPTISLAGKRTQKALANYDEAFGRKAKVLYEDFYDELPQNYSFPLDNFSEVLSNDVIKRGPLSSLFNTPTARNLMTRYQEHYLGQGGQHLPVPWNEVRELRSVIGERMSRGAKSMNPPEDIDDLRRLYAALSRDMKDAAGAVSTEAADKFRVANNYYSSNMKMMDDHLNRLYKVASPEKLHRSIESTIRTGNLSDMAALKRAFKADKDYGDKNWEAVTNTVMRRMMLSEDEAVPNLSNFVESYRKMDNNMKTLLFGSKNMDKRKALDELSDVGSMYSLPQEQANPLMLRQELRRATGPVTGLFGQATGVGGAAGGLLGGGVAGAGAGALFGAASAIAGPWVTAKMLTSPKVAKWLAEAVTVSPNGVGAHMGRLVAIAKGLPDDEYDAVMDYYAAIGEISDYSIGGE